MKKFVAILLTLMLVLGMTAAVAEETPTYTDMATVTIKKAYKLTNDDTTSPADTFTLVQDGDGTVTDGDAAAAPALGTITGATFAAGAATVAGTTGNITVALPSYEKVGKYEYTLKEVAGTTAGVTYYGNDIKLVVTVVNGENGKLRVAAVHTEGKDETKNDTFTNIYSAGKLNITKTVTGNLGDKSKYFEFKVTLTGETGKTYGETYAVSGGSYDTNPTSIKIGEETTFMLKHGDTISIANLPYGVRYTVTETAAEGYTTTKTGEEGTIDAAEKTAAFTNDKVGSIDTGVTTESLPYVVLMGFVVLAGAALLLKRKAHNN